MYGKVFESIFDSTLSADGGWLPTYVFMSMIVLADQDGLVDIAAKALYRRLGFRDYDSKITYEDFESAIEYLTREDPDSRSPDENGRRIVALVDLPNEPSNRGYKIVNYLYYRQRAGRDDRAAQSTARSRRFRERKKANKNNNETPRDAGQRMGRHTDTDTDTNISHSGVNRSRDFNGRKAPADFEPPAGFVQKMRDETGLSDTEIAEATVRFKDHCFERSTFDWDGRWRNWIRTERKHGPAGAGPAAKTKFEKLFGSEVETDAS